MSKKNESKLILEPSFCGNEPSKFCNTCGSTVGYPVQQLKFGTIRIPMCNDCLKRLSLDITNHLDSQK